MATKAELEKTHRWLGIVTIVLGIVVMLGLGMLVGGYFFNANTETSDEKIENVIEQRGWFNDASTNIITYTLNFSDNSTESEIWNFKFITSVDTSFTVPSCECSTTTTTVPPIITTTTVPPPCECDVTTTTVPPPCECDVTTTTTPPQTTTTTTTPPQTTTTTTTTPPQTTTTTATIPVPITLGVVLTATPNSGPVPLNGVMLTATLSGTATGDAYYFFECGTGVTFAKNIDRDSYTTGGICAYANLGVYIVKVTVTREGITVVDTVTISVTE